ncbi:histidine kinase [Flavobacteriaceae bacterium]|nr:histidine kinase [Flavobacteriaceae bacterium]
MNSRGFYTITLKHHIVFWTIYFLINTFRWGRYFDDFLYSFQSGLLGFPIHIFLCYLNIYVLMPRFIFKKKYSLFILFLLSSIFMMVVVKFNLTYYLLNSNVWPEGPEIVNTLTANYVMDMMIGELYVITFVTAIKITSDWIKENKRSSDLEKAQLETQLLFLRSQVSPHFFFNTLNNIYSLSLEGSKRTPKVILKLSELMRYLIYDTKNKRQDLKNEIICIQNYLELEKIRYSDNLEINMNIIGQIEGKVIAPILLLSFVENAFKHGANKSIDKIKIDIDFNVKGDFLNFKIVNQIPVRPKNKQIFKRNQGGIGLSNVKKRLKLGYKKDDYKMSINSSNNLFTVKLKIKV